MLTNTPARRRFLPSGTVLVVAALLAVTASSAHAQPAVAQSFEQLQVLLAVGNSVKLTDGVGDRSKGHVVAISGDRLIVDIGGKKTTFLERDVAEITRRGGDPLNNGAWWGFAVGSGVGAAGYAAWCATAACSASDAWIIPVYGAMGAGIGVGFDALIRGQRPVYRAPMRRLTTSVMVTPRRTGAGVSIAF
jgi:hypothetical protein